MLMHNSQENIVDQECENRPNKSLRPVHSLQFKPCDLLDALIKHLGVKNDAELSRALELAAPLISKLRSQVLPVSAFVLVRMHEVSGLSIADLRGLMGDHRKKFGVNDNELTASDSGTGMLKPQQGIYR
jgi:hypothetical protein